MKISGSYTVPFERDRAYALLQDPDILAKCMPGCDHLARIAEDEYEMRMKILIASLNGLFAGKVRISDQNPPGSFKLIVEGSGKIGFMKGEGLLTLVPSEASTEVRYDGEVHVGGSIASVGQRLVDATGKLVIKRFFTKLGKIASGEPEAEEADVEAG